MERLQVFSGSPYESLMGYCRAVRLGPHVYLAGTAPIMPGDADPPSDAHGQTHRCFEIMRAALEEAGGGLEHVVRTRIYVVPGTDFDGVARAHGELFRDIRPVNTTVIVHSLVDPRWLLEIDAEAYVPADTG